MYKSLILSLTLPSLFLREWWFIPILQMRKLRPKLETDNVGMWLQSGWLGLGSWLLSWVTVRSIGGLASLGSCWVPGPGLVWVEKMGWFILILLGRFITHGSFMLQASSPPPALPPRLCAGCCKQAGEVRCFPGVSVCNKVPGWKGCWSMKYTPKSGWTSVLLGAGHPYLDGHSFPGGHSWLRSWTYKKGLIVLSSRWSAWPFHQGLHKDGCDRELYGLWLYLRAPPTSRSPLSCEETLRCCLWFPMNLPQLFQIQLGCHCLAWLTWNLPACLVPGNSSPHPVGSTQTSLLGFKVGRSR